MQRQYPVREVRAGTVTFGGNRPVVLQSMTNTSTQDVKATAAQCMRIANAGAHIVRVSAKNKAELIALTKIRELMVTAKVPLIADIHFSSSLAVEAAKLVEKVRINPGNFYHSGKNMNDREYVDGITQKIQPLIAACKKHQTAIRIGTNHGSLSARIKERYGTGATAMAEACMEFARITALSGFSDVVLSVKASNVFENIKATSLLAHMQQTKGFSYPLHLGVTEAGLGFTGRIKSAAGIGALLADGIGDTIRVSLTEEPEKEIPVAQNIASLFQPTQKDFAVKDKFNTVLQSNKTSVSPGFLHQVKSLGFIVMGHQSHEYLSGYEPDVFLENLPADRCILLKGKKIPSLSDTDHHSVFFIQTEGSRGLYEFREIYIELCRQITSPFVIWMPQVSSGEISVLRFAAESANLLASGVIHGCCPIAGNEVLPKVMATLFEVLQACRIRNTHAEFISCPSCNRTAFDIMQLAEEVRAKTHHLIGLTIAVMGCIVNGPGEMGAADYGLVGQGRGLLSLYYKGEVIRKNIPESQACKVLLDEIELREKR
jgi:(E)-4-hydroxy-3-methylbut-2-enyl-diphosphate synthase